MVADGTYIYCEKSQNSKLQKELYSMHKYRHLSKPFVVCTTDGLIVDVFGPCSAKVNDANILMSILKDSDLQNLLQPNDNIILDRGFRDCIDELKKTYKLIPRMPTFTDGQLTFLQANQTRLVTKVRLLLKLSMEYLTSHFQH